MLYRYCLTLSIMLGCFSIEAYADKLAVEFSGFASLTASYSDNSDIGFRSNYLNQNHTGWSIQRDSILGGQANISLAKNVDSVVQIVLQDRENKSLTNLLELAFLRYRPTRNWALRAGRLNSDLYLLSEYPNVGFAYLWTRPPHEYYAFASTAGHFDGIDIEYSQDINDGFLRVKLAYGQTTPKFGAGDEKFEATFEDLLTLSGVYVKNAWTIRASTSHVNISAFKSVPYSYLVNGLNAIPTNLWPQAERFAWGLDSQYHDITFKSLGLTYDDFDWLVQAEIGSADTNWLTGPSNITGYVSVGYRFNDITYFTGISVVDSKRNVPNVNAPELPEYIPPELRMAVAQLAAGTKITLQRSLVDQYSLNFGAKWYYSDKIVFKAQLDHFVIKPIGGGLWDINTPADIETRHNINLFSLSGSMVF